MNYGPICQFPVSGTTFKSKYSSILISALLSLCSCLVISCSDSTDLVYPESAREIRGDDEMNHQNIGDSKNLSEMPEYLKHWPGLYVREGEQIVEAPAKDTAVAQSYPTWEDKGSLIAGRRLTILTAKKTYHVNEKIRVIHVLEVPEPGYEVYVMGPKPVYGEYVDGKLATAPLSEDEDPFVPLNYNGRVVPSPAVDYNYEITSYTFSKPGTHQIYWQLGPVKSNVLTLEIIP